MEDERVHVDDPSSVGSGTQMVDRSDAVDKDGDEKKHESSSGGACAGDGSTWKCPDEEVGSSTTEVSNVTAKNVAEAMMKEAVVENVMDKVDADTSLPQSESKLEETIECGSSTGSPRAIDEDCDVRSDDAAESRDSGKPIGSGRRSRSSSAHSRTGRGGSNPGRTTATARNIVRNAVTSPSLYCGDLHEDVTESTLMEIFTTVCAIQSVRVCRDVVTRRSLGYAYINFFTVRDAERALESLNFYSSALTKHKPLRVMWKIRDPTMRRSGEGNVFIKGLSDDVDNKLLHDGFSKYGSILSCKVATDKDDRPLGYGFVHFSSAESAAKAIDEADGSILCGKAISVGRFRTRREREASGDTASTSKFTNVYVKNLPPCLSSEEELRVHFGDFGEITSVHVAEDEMGMPRGFAFLNFAQSECAAMCVNEMNGLEVDGYELTVCRAQSRAERDSALARALEARRRERSAKYQGVNLYVKNLGEDVDDGELRKLFEGFGAVISCRVMLDENGYSRGFGFVCFAQAEEATKAVTELNGRLVGNKPIYVALAQHKEARRAQLEAQRVAAQRIRSSAVPPSAMYAQPKAAPYVGRPGATSVIAGPTASASTNTGSYGGSGRHTTAGMYPKQAAAHAPRAQNDYVELAQRHVAVPSQPRTSVVGSAVHHGYRNVAYPTAAREPRRNRIRSGAGAAGGSAYPMRAMGMGLGAERERTRRVVRDVDLAAARARSVPPTTPAKAVKAVRIPKALTVEMLTSATPKEQKQMLGEQLYPKIHKIEPVLAAKITGMLLEMEMTEVLHLLDTPEALREQVRRAIECLRQHEATLAKKATEAQH